MYHYSKGNEWKATLRGNGISFYDDLFKLEMLLKNTPDDDQYDEKLYGSGHVSKTITTALLQLI